MINNIDDYLKQLRKELAGCDRAIIQDALSDAGEHLKNSVESLHSENPDISDSEALGRIIEGYGTPAEIAAIYKEMESRISPSLAPEKKAGNRSLLAAFFGVVIDPRTYGAFFYLIFSLALGIIYFTWAVTGLSLSLGLLILIFGILIFGIFILSVRGISLMEGRLVEALLGIRMPRRTFFSTTERGLWPKFKSVISDQYTWFALIYMLLMLPLGIFYFSLFVSLIATSAWLVVEPILQIIYGASSLHIDYHIYYYTPAWLIPFSIIGGMLLFVITLHLAKLIGKLHGNLAKVMLVRG
jgi:uncharacterized membrane protein